MNIENPKMIGDANKHRILDLIRREPISRAEIADILEISRPAVTKNVNAILEAGIIIEGQSDASLVGRKPLLLEFNSTIGYIMGLSIRSKTIDSVLGDLCGNILEKNSLPIASRDDPEIVYRQIIGCINTLIDRRGITLQDVFSVAISSPGVMNSKTGGYILNPFIKYWDKLDLVKMLKKDLDIDCIISNDVDMSILGEELKGVCKGYNNIAYIKLWDGFAARFIINGQIYRGNNYAAGEIGYMALGEEYLQNEPEISGRLEKMISNSGISRTYKEMCKNNKIDIDYEREYGIRQIFELSRKGDVIADQIIDKLVKYLGIVIINISTVLNPEIVVLGGDLINVNDTFIDEITNIVKNNISFPPKVVRGVLGEESENIGCISVALEEANKKLQKLW